MLEAGVKLLVVELAFDDQSFQLESTTRALQLRGNGIMWQKERLLNRAVETLPESCRKIMWIDCDLIFEDPRWLENSCSYLDRYVVIQPFTHVARLPRGQSLYRGQGEVYEGFASIWMRTPESAKYANWEGHGHTGFAWGARRELFDLCGLYDPCLTGSADHLMAHAFVSSSDSSCIEGMIGRHNRYHEHFMAWAEKATRLVGGSLGAVPGRILHLWHGELADRRYHSRNQQFRTFDFDPDRDLRIDENGLWTWGDAPRSMQLWAHQMFLLRNEDGDMIFRRR